MADSSGVIVQTLEAGVFKAPPKAHPSSVYVLSYKDGSVRSFPGAPSVTERRGSRFCYVVDTSEHGVTGECIVASAVDAYSFTVEMNATWRVTDPAAAVQDNLADGGATVIGWLTDQLWQVGRQFPPRLAAEAETEARRLLQGAHSLTQGITVTAAAARFRGDSTLDVGTKALDEDSLQGALELQRVTRLKDRLANGDNALLLEHLLQHPEDTPTLINMIAASNQQDQAVRLGLLKDLMDRGMITDADLDGFRAALLGGTALPVGGHAAISQGTTGQTAIGQTPAVYGAGGAGTGGHSRPQLSLPSGVTPGTPAVGSAPVSGYVTPDDDDDEPAPAPAARTRPVRRPTAAGTRPPAETPGTGTIGSGNAPGNSPGGRVVGVKKVGRNRPQGGQ